MANINTTVLTIGENNLVLQDGGLRANKVSSFQSTPDNDHFPSEKLVKDSLDLKLNSSMKGANNGVAELDSSGKVPDSQLPTIPDVSTKYDTADTAETTLDDADYIPFYDTSATARKKSLWSNIKSKLKTYFDRFYLTSHQDISGKADKVSNPTNGNFASLDSNGNIADSGHKHSDYITSHQDISGKADKVGNASDGNLASLKSDGNLADSGLSSSAVQISVNKSHSHSNKTILDKIPSSLGSAYQVMMMNSDGTSIVFATLSGGSANFDLTPLTPITHSNQNTTESVTFVANQRNTIWINASVNLNIAITCNNHAENYILVSNTSSSNLEVTIATINSSSSNFTVAGGEITVPAGKKCEIGVLEYTNGANSTHYIITHVEI